MIFGFARPMTTPTATSEHVAATTPEGNALRQKHRIVIHDHTTTIRYSHSQGPKGSKNAQKA